MKQTTLANDQSVIHGWYITDADGQVLGRLATKLATVLMGKHKPTYTPYVDTGDFVVVVNAEKIKITGRKLDQKFKTSYSGYPGGQRHTSYRKILNTHPERLLIDAVRRMLPKSALGRKMLGKLKVYEGAAHPHAANTPKPLN